MGLAGIPGLGGRAAMLRVAAERRRQRRGARRWHSPCCLTCTCASKRNKRLDKLEEQFPEALDFLARSMRAGHAFTISLQMVGEEMPDPLGLEFRTLFNEQNLGAPLDTALRNFATGSAAGRAFLHLRRCCCRSRPAAT